MKPMRQMLFHRGANSLLGILLSALWVYFAYRHVQAFFLTGIYAYLIFCFSESLQAVLFIIRTEPKAVSLDPFAWLVAIGGTFAALCFTPGGIVLWQGGSTLVLSGVIIQIAALFSLNRSFAIVAARREIKINGLYRIVRHPMYLSYLFVFTGYVLFNASVLNLACFVFAMTFLFLRITEEERQLIGDDSYIAYTKRVPWKLIPFIY